MFAAAQLDGLRAATAELSWLLARRYAIKSALKLVGDRHGLTERQRLAIARAACSDESLERRRACCVGVEELRGEPVLIDGFNLLITLEAALSGGLLIRCRDGCVRDLSSVHGSYRSVQETRVALTLLGATLAHLNVASAHWLLDRPISNSGRLAARIRAEAAQQGWPWTCELAFNPDVLLQTSAAIALTSDSTILDNVARWTNLTAHLLTQAQIKTWLIDLQV